MEKTKIIDVDGVQYQLGKLGAEEGSFIHWRMLGTLLKQTPQDQEPPTPPKEDENPAENPDNETKTKKLSDEDQAKMLCTVAFMQGMSFEDMQFAQKRALRVVSRIENVNGNSHPIPILTGNGRFVPEEIGTDAALISRLTIEALAFNLAPFFSKSRSVSL